MLDRDVILTGLQDVFEEYISLWEVASLETSLSLRKDLNLELADLLNIIGSIEEQFNIELTLKAFLNCETIGDVVNYIQNTQKINGSEN